MECNQEVMEEMQKKLTNAWKVVGGIHSGLTETAASAIQEIIDVVQFLLDNAELRERYMYTTKGKYRNGCSG